MTKEQEPVAFGRAEAWSRLYSVASRLAAYLGYHGTVEAKSDLGHLLVDALNGIDGGNDCPGLMPQAEPAKMKLLTAEELPRITSATLPTDYVVAIQRAAFKKNGLQIEGDAT